MTKGNNITKLAIAVPTYNESTNLPKLIKEIKKTVSKLNNLSVFLLVIDDNSPDGTGQLAERLARTEQTNRFNMGVLHRSKKEGLGKAYIHGLSELLKGRYDFILEMDADLSHSPKYIAKFIAKASSAEVVVGSRFIKGGRTPDWALHRKLLSRFGNIYIKIFLGKRVHDYTGGYNLYSTTLLKKISLNSIRSNGYEFQIELKYRVLQHTKNVKEVPIIFWDRQQGLSKIPRRTILTTLVRVPIMRLKK